MGLAANNWKAEEIATRNYPNFSKKHAGAIQAQRLVDDVDTSNAGKKRTHSTNKHKSKRPKLDRMQLPNPLYVIHDLICK